MARVALILRYQWRAYWRRFIRTRHRAQFYFTALLVLGWLFVVIWPPLLSRAARELAAGQTTAMDAVLWLQCVLWLLVLVEDGSVSLTSRHLLRFPIGVRSLLGVRILSLFCSPVALVIAAGSVISLWPLLSARHALGAGCAALMLIALVFALGMSASHLLSVVAESRRKLLLAAAIIGVALGAFFVHRPQHIEQLAGGVAFAPPHLVSTIAVGATLSAVFIPFLALLAGSVAAGYLLFWSFRRSLFIQTAVRAAGRTAASGLWFPGRFGGLVRKEQYYFFRLLDVWLGLLLVVAISVESLFGSPPPIIRQAIILIVFALNVNVMMNGFGLDTSAELHRYFILPLRGRDVLLVKNAGLTVVVAIQLAPLILTAAWRSGPAEAGAEIIEATVLLLSHLAWGNMVSVAAPFKMQLYRFASNGAPLTAMAGTTIGSVPGVTVLVVLHSTMPFASASLAIAAISALVLTLYLVSLHAAGRNVERRRQMISERLS